MCRMRIRCSTRCAGAIRHAGGLQSLQLQRRPRGAEARDVQEPGALHGKKPEVGCAHRDKTGKACRRDPGFMRQHDRTGEDTEREISAPSGQSGSGHGHTAVSEADSRPSGAGKSRDVHRYTVLPDEMPVLLLHFEPGAGAGDRQISAGALQRDRILCCEDKRKT